MYGILNYTEINYLKPINMILLIFLLLIGRADGCFIRGPSGQLQRLNQTLERKIEPIRIQPHSKIYVNIPSEPTFRTYIQDRNIFSIQSVSVKHSSSSSIRSIWKKTSLITHSSEGKSIFSAKLIQKRNMEWEMGKIIGISTSEHLSGLHKACIFLSDYLYPEYMRRWEIFKRRYLYLK